MGKAADMCIAYEATTAQVEVITGQSGNRYNIDEKQIHFVKSKGRREHKSIHRQAKHNDNRTKRYVNTAAASVMTASVRPMEKTGKMW